jgi:hypothetical protein
VSDRRALIAGVAIARALWALAWVLPALVRRLGPGGTANAARPGGR